MATASRRVRPRPHGRPAAERKHPQSSELDRLAALKPDAVLAELGSTADGLTSTDAADRLERAGANELVSSRRTALSVLLAQVRSPLLGLLLCAAVDALIWGYVAALHSC